MAPVTRVSVLPLSFARFFFFLLPVMSSVESNICPGFCDWRLDPLRYALCAFLVSLRSMGRYRYLAIAPAIGVHAETFVFFLALGVGHRRFSPRHVVSPCDVDGEAPSHDRDGRIHLGLLSFTP